MESPEKDDLDANTWIGSQHVVNRLPIFVTRGGHARHGGKKRLLLQSDLSNTYPEVNPPVMDVLEKDENPMRDLTPSFHTPDILPQKSSPSLQPSVKSSDIPLLLNSDATSS